MFLKDDSFAYFHSFERFLLQIMFSMNKQTKIVKENDP